ncbi:DNA-processing protein DprA [Hutsoniella sourekii]|uniref:DNA-processing protein DprA n=1 Tax=Hutsoniella sourekii TaxID=87650 RepID=UPI0004B75493|nr:DNA-processing protein DprA [Hutsoniella sourekii]
MEITLKEQLIYLQSQGMTYSQQWKYLRSYYARVGKEAGSLADCQAVLSQVQSQLGKCWAQEISFRDYPSLQAQVRSWSQEAIFIEETDLFPRIWLEIPQPPLLIYYRGRIDLLKQPCVSLVGTRQISSYGRKVTQELTQAIIDQGWVVVSGLAQGIDTISHQTADQWQSGQTIAIIATGLDQAYPTSNQQLQDRLSQRHLVLSEYPPKQGALKHHFVMRNRLVAGLSPVTIVIEAAQKSGSLITANYALQFNREVLAVPGRIDDPCSKGCNLLIQAGAQPVVDLADTIQTIAELMAFQQIN